VVRFIAEIGSNHNRDRERCLELVDTAALAGCAAVKLQLFRVEDLFAAEALARHPTLAARRAWELPLELLSPIRERCEARGVELGATPFGPWAVESLVDHVDFFKISSYDLLRHELIRMCAATGRPLVLSTGMATLDEVALAVQAGSGTSLRLLHCVSGYPTPPRQANLAAIATLRERFGIPVGWSDHTCSEPVVARAVLRWRASDVELHIDIDGTGREAGEHNWSPRRLRALIASLEQTTRETEQPRRSTDSTRKPAGASPPRSEDGSPGEESFDGDGVKRPMPIELPDVSWRADPADGLRPLRSLRAQLGRAA
jgi:sialic acid synthase SpsE